MQGSVAKDDRDGLLVLVMVGIRHGARAGPGSSIPCHTARADSCIHTAGMADGAELPGTPPAKDVYTAV